MAKPESISGEGEAARWRPEYKMRKERQPKHCCWNPNPLKAQEKREDDSYYSNDFNTI